MATVAQMKQETGSDATREASTGVPEDGGLGTNLDEDAAQETWLEDDFDPARDHQDDAENGDGRPAASPNSENPRRRRRSRKGLDKKFDCPFGGCGKSYSRAEHLHRHQLNHNAKVVLTCGFQGCNKTFVRPDLKSRHEERHTARGSAIGRRDSVVGPSPTNDQPLAAGVSVGHAAATVPGSLSPESNRPPTAFPGIPVLRPSAPYQSSPQVSVPNPYTPIIANTPPTPFSANMVANGPAADGSYAPPDRYVGLASRSQPARRRRSHAHAAVSHPANIPPHPPPPPPQYDVVLPVPTYPPHATVQPVSYVSQQGVVPVSLPPPTYMHEHGGVSFARDAAPPYAPPVTTAAEFHQQEAANQSSEMMMLDQMSMQATVPVFGNDGLSNKAPYAIPEDFIAYLFNTQSGNLQQMTNVVQYQNGYNDYNTRYGAPYLGHEGLPPSYYAASAPHEIMAVNNLLDQQNVPEATISEEKSQEIFDFIKERFLERNRPPLEKRRDGFLEGDRSDPDHVLSKRMMQAYIGAYWLHFSDQMPILHKPSFSPDKTPTLLLIAMMTIGASCLDRTPELNPTRSGGDWVSNFLAWSLRFEVFADANFAPPSKLWIFQTLILLELYEKMLTTRELHERAHIHHATTITLMRRGRSLIGKSALESPPNLRIDAPVTSAQQQHPSMMPGGGGGTATPDDWWHNWITHESTRRTAFAAFVVDSIHCTMFGHSTVMVAHEMRLPLPCDDSLWDAANAADFARIEAKTVAAGLKPVSFLEGLKRTLNNEAVHTNSFGRTVLMAGLLSVAWHMNQRDLQINVLGNSPLAMGGRENWRSDITRAFEHWKADYDKALRPPERAQDPYRFSVTGRRSDDKTVFESRIVLLHLAHMATNADIVECQMFARAKRLMGRPITPQDLHHVQVHMRDNWAPSSRGRAAAFWALKFLLSVLMPDAAGAGADAPRPGGYEQLSMPYSARDDMLLNRPWVLYFAALVLWSYGHALEGPCSDAPLPATPHEMVAQMRDYLSTYATIHSPDDLVHKRGVGNNNAVMMVLREAFKLTRWELLHEAANLLNNCIVLSSGGSVV